MKRLSCILVTLFVTSSLFALLPPMRQFVVTSSVGYRLNPMGGGPEALHRGVDLVGPAGAQILATASGVVIEHWPAPGGKWRGHPTFGGYIVLSHGNGVYSIYGHMSKTFVHTDQIVRKGQVIGIQGATGQATGPHLHFEVLVSPLILFDVPLGIGLEEYRRLLK